MAANLPRHAEIRERIPFMKRIVVGLAVLAFVMAASSLYAQETEHGAFGIYADYFRLSATGNTNYGGIGGRVGFNVWRDLQLEGQMTYDIPQDFKTVIPNPFTTVNTSSSVSLLHGLFGPKYAFYVKHTRIFGTVQGGFIRIGASSSGIGSAFVSSVSQIGDTIGSTNTSGALYPGGGVEHYFGRYGIRVDAGDLIYWNGGAHNNLVLKVGPQMKF
jgi:hypothetical protein